MGEVVAERKGNVKGEPVLLLTFDVQQRVKGNVSSTIVIRTPSGTDCDVQVPQNQAIGLFLTRAPDGTWLATACSVVEPGPLVVEGGQPRGGPIKVGVGLVILALVLLWARSRLRRKVRPKIPGAPEP